MSSSSDSHALDYGEQERRRMHNLAWARSQVAGCLREYLVCNYHPGEVWYNHNEYPARPLRRPDEYDVKLFAEYRSRGVEIIKLHQECADWLEICGGDFFTSNDPEGLESLCRMAHAEKLRVHVYFSSGYLDYRHRNFKPGWSSTRLRLDECYWRLAMCSCRNPEWRGYLLQRIAELLDRYPVDGLYNDCGFHRYFHPAWRPSNLENPDDLWESFDDTPGHEASFEDLLGRLYSLLKEKRPAGLMTLHFGNKRRPPIKTKYYDRLYVGEGVRTLEDLCEKTKTFDPYTFLIADSRLGSISPRAVYAGGLPYLQFPVLYDGYPVTGERAFAEGVEYMDPEKNYWQAAMKRIRELRAQGAPPTYGWWDRAPGHPRTKPIFYHFLQLWRQIAKNGTRAFLEVEAEVLSSTENRGLVQSLFINEDIYLIAANHGQADAKVALRCAAVDCEDVSSPAMSANCNLTIPANDLKILKLLPVIPSSHKTSAPSAFSSTPASHEQI
jgi:hypothetical protein